MSLRKLKLYTNNEKKHMKESIFACLFENIDVVVFC